MFARNLTGPWHFTLHEAFNSSVAYTDGTVELYKRRERPKLYFSDDGLLAPLYLITGVQEMNATGPSFNHVQPKTEFCDSIAQHVPNYVTSSRRTTFRGRVNLPDGAQRPIAILSENNSYFQNNVRNPDSFQYWAEIDPDTGEFAMPRVVFDAIELFY
ncbi:hypothetical protein P170DRAFT_479637 [Aspergillus steynii IBT 23096]|uniref:Rhamnogalacturonan lyase domain-containing protein n=1 Tax=Aspergillus steynii IBT 23096 TaxID=1392250 RepID=A0A2I2FWU4_9EURO|nr:uncharacterized protein P170DRAFT_479637 [Aspergillus steynii IBT 23096]PLB45110.1 hypothetical protein P170DRAFT_479637 [Aspergillus steynii IBT 23096]